MEYGQTVPRALKTANGIQHAEWVLLASDLQRCLELVGLWSQLLSLDEKTPREIRLAESLFRDTVVSFVSCFDKDKGHVCLDAQSLYGSIDGALAAFQWFYNVRNQSIAHRYGPHRLAHTMVIIDEDNGEILGNGVGVYTMYQPSTDGVDALTSLIQVALKHADAQVEYLSVQCKAEIEEMYPSARRRLELASYRVPNENSLRLGRRKYENINRQIRSDWVLPIHHALKETRATIVKLNVPTRDGGYILAGMEVLGIREDDGTWCAISLELDIQGYGADPESACADLATSMEAQFEFAINDERGDFDQLFFATERQYFEMFNEYRRTATLVQFKKLAEELRLMSVTNTTDSDIRPAIRLHAIEDSNATTDIVGSEHD